MIDPENVPARLIRSVSSLSRRLLVTSAAVLTVAAWAAAASAEPAMLKAGAATSNITPPLGAEIVGGFQPFPATHVHDELHARCLVLDDGRTKVALVVCDLLGLHHAVSVEARRLIARSTGIPPSHVLISATHTHSAASALGSKRYDPEAPLDDYQAFVARRIADGVRRAVNLLRPAELAFGTVEAPEHVFNRRWYLSEGKMPLNPFGELDKVKMNPSAGSSDLIEPAGPTDPSVSFIAAREPGGRLISVYSAYSLHYVGGVGDGHLSADYYGMYCEALKQRVTPSDGDPPFVAMMANGTSGDVNNINFRSPRPRQPPYAQMKKVAEDLAGKVSVALAKVAWSDRAVLAAHYRELKLEWRRVDPKLLDWARETAAKAGSATAKDVIPQSYAGRVQRLAQAVNPALAPVQVLKIGDVCIGTSPCETFAETGLEFKKRSPAKHSFLVELSHGYLGYLPTPRHFALGGYETWPGTNILEPQAAVKILDALVEMATTMSSPSQ